jgi:hypothetical protein
MYICRVFEKPANVSYNNNIISNLYIGRTSTISFAPFLRTEDHLKISYFLLYYLRVKVAFILMQVFQNFVALYIITQFCFDFMKNGREYLCSLTF